MQNIKTRHAYIYITCTWKAVESDVCQNAAANFINKYNLSISVAELNALVGEGWFCGCEETYNCKANKLLFFAREDIKEIIDNNLLYDPNNANLSSFDILQSYANSQCNENIASMTYNELMDDIGASGDFILEDIYFKDCKNLYCVYNDIKNLPNNFYSNLIKDLHEDKTLLIEMSVGTNCSPRISSN